MADLRWKTDIRVSIHCPDGWEVVRGDLLVVDDREALSVHTPSECIGHLWVISHVPSGRRVVGLGSREEARRVAEEIAGRAPAWLWASSRGREIRPARLRRIGLAMGLAVRPSFDGRRVWVSGGWRQHPPVLGAA